MSLSDTEITAILSDVRALAWNREKKNHQNE